MSPLDRIEQLNREVSRLTSENAALRSQAKRDSEMIANLNDTIFCRDAEIAEMAAAWAKSLLSRHA